MSLNGSQLHLPNALHFNHGTCHFSEHFGGIYSITPRCLTGEGHVASVQVRFTFGLRLDFSPEVFAELIRQGPAALAKMPYLPDVHDAVGEEML
jgi:hypothetical protein